MWQMTRETGSSSPFGLPAFSLDYRLPRRAADADCAPGESGWVGHQGKCGLRSTTASENSLSRRILSCRRCRPPGGVLLFGKRGANHD
jgi:hypothetical protein